MCESESILKLSGLAAIFVTSGLKLTGDRDRDLQLTTIKGQAGQAIQCLNLMMGWDETLGLPQGFILDFNQEVRGQGSGFYRRLSFPSS